MKRSRILRIYRLKIAVLVFVCTAFIVATYWVLSHRLTTDLIEVKSMHVALDSTGGAELTATIQNHSNVLLHEVTLFVTMQDTPNGKPNFKDPDIISRGMITLPVEIPSGATREASVQMRIAGAPNPARGQLAWTQEILAVK